MPEDLNDVARWRSLAAEALSLAAQMSDPTSKQTMLSIALGYEHIAQRAERRVNADKVGKKRRAVDDGANVLAALLPIVLPLLNWAAAPSRTRFSSLSKASPLSHLLSFDLLHAIWSMCPSSGALRQFEVFSKGGSGSVEVSA
jgi:hypothetical protein